MLLCLSDPHKEKEDLCYNIRKNHDPHCVSGLLYSKVYEVLEGDDDSRSSQLDRTNRGGPRNSNSCVEYKLVM